MKKNPFWTRFERAWKVWGKEFRRLTKWVAYLGGNYDRVNNWKQGRGKPEGGSGELERLYTRLREKGCDVEALALYVYDGTGMMPRPSGRGAVVPNVSAPSAPAPAAVQGVAQPVVDTLSLFERIREGLRQGEDVTALVDFGIEALSKARKLGIAGIAGAGVGLSLLFGAPRSSHAASRTDHENQLFFRSRRRRGLLTRLPSGVTGKSVVERHAKAAI